MSPRSTTVLALAAPTLAALVLGSACGPSAATPCESSRECSAAGLVCDFARGECVQCVSGADCLAEGEVCRASRCEAVAPCTSSRMCPGLVCDPARGYCVECVTDIDCPGDSTCDGDGFCQSPPPPCTSDRMCSELGLVCDPVAQVCVECVREADCTDGFVCLAQRCQRGELDGGPRIDSGPGFDAGPDFDAGPNFDAGPMSTDAGPRADTGPDFDAGPMSADAGPIGTDAGPDAGRDTGTDAGRDAGTDAGPLSTGCGFVIVLDSSGSMSDPPNSGDSKYVRQQRVVNQWLASLDGQTQAGAVFQPDQTTGPSCDLGARGALTVPVAPLSSSRSAIASQFASRTPSDVGPLFDALDDAYDGVSMLDPTRSRAVIVLADGGHTCSDRSGRDAVMQRAATQAAAGVPTYVIALATSDSDLSTLASRGGTGSAGCSEGCGGGGGGLCTTAADCDATEACTDLVAGLLRTCTCASTANCPAGETCQPQNFSGLPYNACVGSGTCCNARIDDPNFDTRLRAELDRITLDFCP